MVSPEMVYIRGEEMTTYCMDLILDKWIYPHVDTSKWEFFDLSCKSRDETDDQVLRDAVNAGKRIGSIFKEPTVTPSAEQRKSMGLKKALPSPNGAMRRGWNGITISRDTIHIEGLKLGFEKPVLFERHAVGGEYGAGYDTVGSGVLNTIFTAENGKTIVVDSRQLDNKSNAVVTYHNPLDNVEDMAHIFFQRCLEAEVTPYVVTKKTVFKWQEPFWLKFKEIFDEHYRAEFLGRGLILKTGGELQHLISDAATMQIIRWTGGGFGMAAHNYDGDMLTDEIAQIHRSPGFITSNLIGKNDDGSLIKEFEASHGTVADMWHAHLEGKETSLNPLGLVEALIGAIQHSVALHKGPHELHDFANKIRRCMHLAFTNGLGTRDLAGPEGLTTEKFVDAIAELLNDAPLDQVIDKYNPQHNVTKQAADASTFDIDEQAMKKLFEDLDTNKDGSLCYKEFAQGLKRLNVAPKKGQRLRMLRISLEDPI